MHLNRLTQPEAEPLTTAQAKQHLRLDAGFTDDDDYVGILITVAREYCEDYTRRYIGPCDFELILDSFPLNKNYIELPVSPLVSVTYVKAFDAWANEVDMNPADYIADVDRTPGAVFLPLFNIWPVIVPQAGVAVRIKFNAGYAPEDVPKRYLQAMLLLIGHWYNNREEVTDARKIEQIPIGVDSLLMPLKVW